jgi:hypothetical protein
MSGGPKKKHKRSAVTTAYADRNVMYRKRLNRM